MKDQKDIEAPYRQKLKLLPNEAGVYKFLNQDGEVIYIGKAKNLKNRVSSYFNKQAYENRKTRIMVSKVHDLNITVVPTELEALLLENSLIKEFQPKYNINLKDDKSFPLIKITNERFPKIYPMRNPIDDGSEYYGPYASVRLMHVVLELCKQLYPIRNCNLKLSEQNIQDGKFKVCLEYQIGNCRGPCEGLESEEEYMDSIRHIRHILRGNLKEVRQQLKLKMAKAAEEWKYEEAERNKKRLEQLAEYQSRSTVVNPRIDQVDVINLSHVGRTVYVNFMHIANGIIVQSKNYEIKRSMDESDAEIIQRIYADSNRYKREVVELIVPVPLELDIPHSVPKSGDKKKLLDLSLKNAKSFALEKTKHYEKLDPGLKVNRILTTIKNDLKLKQLPKHMECFDNSNFQGKYPVAACVVFRDGKPSKREYRHFNIKTVDGPDDFASMKEVVQRRYKRMLEEGEDLPQLLIVDGGKGQLSSAVEALESLGIYGKLAVVGIAKRLEEIYYPNDPLPLYIDKKSESLKVIQQMRDEAHRFGITHHRNRRSKGSLMSQLTEIKGIGPETATDLLKEFRSVAKLKKASLEEISKVIGPSKAQKIIDHFSA